jgi:hypothetical protein
MPLNAIDTRAPAAEPLAVAAAFLRALGDPEAGADLYALHAADAPLRHAAGLRPAAELDVEEFARAHRAISLRGRDALPVYGAPLLLRAPEAWPADQAVVWIEIPETRRGHRLVAALGLRCGSDGTARIGWCTLAAAVAPWRYGDGLLQSLADYPGMRGSEPGAARALLDAAWMRCHGRTPVTFTALPDARFSCQMSTACCRHDFEIPLPPEAQLLIDAMPWGSLRPELAGTRLPVRADGQLQLKALDETCRFLGARRQCLIHETLGRQPFGPCAVFPFAFARTPEGVAVSLSPICASTRMGFGIAPHEREEDLRERLLQSQPRSTEEYRLAPGIALPWESFRDIEKALRDCLAALDFPMRRRLYVGVRLLGALRDEQPVETQRWLTEPIPPITGELREAIHGMLARILSWDRATLRRLPRALPAGLAAREIGEAPVLKRILDNTLYSKAFSYPYDLTTGFNLLIVLYVVALIMQEAAAGPLTEAMWQELGALGVHGMLKAVLQEGVPEGFLSLFGRSEFGQWVLAV